MRRSFWLLWSGQVVSALGDAFGNMALAWLVYDLTGSKVAMGSLFVVGFLPQMILWAVAAPLIDRLDRRRLMGVVDICRSFLYAMPFVLAQTGHLAIWHLYALSLMVGTAGALFRPASMAILPSLVEPRQLVRANAISEGAFSAMNLAGPVLAGGVIAMAGAQPAMLADSISFAISAVTLFLLPGTAAGPEVKAPGGEPGKAGSAPVDTPARVPVHESYTAQLAAGFRFFGQARALLAIMLLLAVANMGGMATGTMLIPFVRDQLGAGPTAVGILEAAMPLGYIAGTAVTGLLGDVRRRRVPMLASLAVGGVLTACLAFIGRGGIIPAVAVTFLVGLAGPFFNTYSTSIYQLVVPDRLRGRVMSVRLLIGQGMGPVGAFLGGLIAQQAGLPTMYLVFGLLSAAVALGGFALPVLKGIDGELHEWGAA